MSAFQPSLFRPDGGQGNSLQPLPLLAMNRSVRAAYADDHGAEPMPRDDRPEGPVFAYIEEEQDGCPCTLLMLRPTVSDLLAADPDLLAFARSCLAQQKELRAWLTQAPGRRDSLSRQDLFNLLAGRKKTAHDSMDDVCTRLIVHADHLVRTVDGGH